MALQFSKWKTTLLVFKVDHPHNPKDLCNAKPNGKLDYSLVHKTKQLKKHSSLIAKPTICMRQRA